MITERAPRLVAAYLGRVWWSSIGLAAVMLGGAVFFSVSPPKDAAAADCPAQFTLNFNGLPAGTILGEQYANFGVHISAQANRDHPDALIVFDTNAPPTHDPDLAVDIGNIAVLAENVRDGNGDGLVDDPDENNFGGRAIFTFDQPVTIRSFVFVDHDHQPADHAAAYDASGNLIKKVVIPIAGNGSVQRIDVNADGVRRFELVYRDSAGFTGIEVECQQQPQPVGPQPQPGGGPQPQPGGGPQPQPGGAPQPQVQPVAQQQQVAVAQAVQAPAPQPAPQPAVVPSMGGSPYGNSALNWMAIALLGAGLVVFTGGVLGWVRDVRRRG